MSFVPVISGPLSVAGRGNGQEALLFVQRNLQQAARQKCQLGRIGRQFANLNRPAGVLAQRLPIAFQPGAQVGGGLLRGGGGGVGEGEMVHRARQINFLGVHLSQAKAVLPDGFDLVAAVG